jgi:hypothetical protein
MMVPLVAVPLIGLAVDATMLRIVQARLSAAVDGAAIGTGRLLGTSADPVSIAKEFVKANFLTDGTAGFWGAKNLSISPVYTPGITKVIAINATAEVPLLFARIFGQQTAVVSAAGTASRTDTRIMLVIDRSSSMSGVTAQVEADAIKFVNSWRAGTDEVGLVIFDGTAVVAYPSYGTYGSATGYSTDISTSGGPDVNFATPVTTAITNMQWGGFTNTSEALWLAYVELQKAHYRDTSGGGKDTRLNAIVMLTDGLPQAVSLFPNNVNPPSTTSPPSVNYFLKSSSGCANKYVNPGNLSPTAMEGFVPVYRNNNQYGKNMFSGQGPNGLYRLWMLDPDHNSSYWVQSWANQTNALKPDTAQSCGALDTQLSNGHPDYDLTKIPSVDAYGNTMSGTAYHVSDWVDTTGARNPTDNPIYQAGWTEMSQSNLKVGQDWEMAMWNATFSAGQRVRSDANKPNRPAGDVQMPIYVYIIGYVANTGLDQGLLTYIANDQAKLGANWDSTTVGGQYYPAADPVAMANAFNNIIATILRLSK